MTFDSHWAQIGMSLTYRHVWDCLVLGNTQQLFFLIDLIYPGNHTHC